MEERNSHTLMNIKISKSVINNNTITKLFVNLYQQGVVMVGNVIQ